MDLGDAIAMCLMEINGFKAEDFAKFHPGGNLGKKLSVSLGDLVDKNRTPQISHDSSLQEVLMSMTAGRYGATVVMKNKKILVIDLDPQGNATTGLGLSNMENSTDTIYGVLNGTKEISEVIKKTQFENLDIITSNVDLSGLEVETAEDGNRAFILKVKLTAYLNNSSSLYDYILIDCPPSPGFAP